METQRILKNVIHVMSLLHIVMSKVAELLKIESLETDLRRCLEVIDIHELSVPPVFVDALITAEDHRSNLHLGIDPIAMLRALKIRVFKGEIQGASTIEQQFVRVVTARYECTISRKIREQMLAISLSHRRPKSAIASAYMSIAFFGSGCTGLKGLKQQFGSDLTKVSYGQALKFLAQLKYPRPLVPSTAWQMKIDRRVRILSYMRA